MGGPNKESSIIRTPHGKVAFSWGGPNNESFFIRTPHKTAVSTNSGKKGKRSPHVGEIRPSRPELAPCLATRRGFFFYSADSLHSGNGAPVFGRPLYSRGRPWRGVVGGKRSNVFWFIIRAPHEKLTFSWGVRIMKISLFGPPLKK